MLPDFKFAKKEDFYFKTSFFTKETKTKPFKTIPNNFSTFRIAQKRYILLTYKIIFNTY